MKTRNDFVSNSSSSSFVIKLEKPIKEYSFEEFADLFISGRNLKEIYNQFKNNHPHETIFWVDAGNESSNNDLEGLEDQLKFEYYEGSYSNNYDGVVVEYVDRQGDRHESKM